MLKSLLCVPFVGLAGALEGFRASKPIPASSPVVSETFGPAIYYAYRFWEIPAMDEYQTVITPGRGAKWVAQDGD